MAIRLFSLGLRALFGLQILLSTLLSTVEAAPHPLRVCGRHTETRVTSITMRDDFEKPVIDIDFPDPSIIRDIDGQWYAFATAGNGQEVQIAKSDNMMGPWKVFNPHTPPLPQMDWTTNRNTWAPSVHRIDSGHYVMYFAAELAEKPGTHCIGVVMSGSIEGPYEDILGEPLTCPDGAGAIDPSGFRESNGRRYLLYKVDGNHMGHGGSCGNTIEPIVSTPIMLQEMAADGVNKVGDPIQILDRTPEDGPLVEAPSLVKTDDGKLYVLFFSSGCYSEDSYNVNYATSENISGPYQRSSGGPVLSSWDDYGLQSPGSATAVEGQGLVFHAHCGHNANGSLKRCMHVTPFSMQTQPVVVLGSSED